jgi:hypothetical protein
MQEMHGMRVAASCRREAAFSSGPAAAHCIEEVS